MLAMVPLAILTAAFEAMDTRLPARAVVAAMELTAVELVPEASTVFMPHTPADT